MPPVDDDRVPCAGTTATGLPCQWRARTDSDFCFRHDPERDTTRAQIGEHELLKRYPMLVDETQPPTAARRLVESSGGSGRYVGGDDIDWRGLPMVEEPGARNDVIVTKRAAT
jgi:hypothetical protein